MKKTFATILIAMAFAQAYAQNDSVRVVKPITFPTLKAVCEDEEFEKDLKAMNFTDVKASVNKLITAAKRKRESVEKYDDILDICKKGEDGLRGTDQVVIVDSVVVDKHAFLSAYPMSEDLGKLSFSKNFETVEYSTQLNGMVFRPEYVDTIEGSHNLRIVRHYIEDGNDSESSLVEGLGIEGDINYPFLLPDGQKFYFAARSEEGFGNYDIYVTRYDNDSKRFYRGENLGYPYNSYANDYMMVVDEDNNIGWFASDRYQPSGKVCVYTFVPNQSRRTIDYENTDHETVIKKASLMSVASLMKKYTDEENEEKATAATYLASMSSNNKKTQKHDFEFVVNDSKTYTTLNQFTKAKAKELCQQWLQKSRNLSSLQQQLDELRNTAPKKEASKIQNLEVRVQELQQEVKALAKSVRKTELSK